MMEYYTGNETGDVPGNLPDPYFWWEAGAMFGALVDYWYYTGDETYNNVTTQALLFQVGEDENYMPSNQSKTEGNDDQSFWGMAVMSAAETKFPNPPEDEPQWLELAQAVFNTQAVRWDNATCGGGLRWQIFTFNNGYDYKNSISNGNFFNLAARLAVYTSNDTYAEWADTMWDWTEFVGLMTSSYEFFDGTSVDDNCTSLNRIQWTYNAGTYLLGAANMYNYTNGSSVWQQRVENILNATDVFFSDDPVNVMEEIACEPNGNCNTDQRSFKAYLSRWMAATTKVAPFTHDAILTKLEASAQAAAQQCSGGSSGTACGLQWTQLSNYDGSTGVGEQMAALEVIQSNLIDTVAGPVTNTTGGTSKGNSAAGTSSNTDETDPAAITDKITTGDKAGAGIFTVFIVANVVGAAWWMIHE